MTTANCNVRESPYFAVGDNRTDDTAAIQRAIDDERCDTVLLSGPDATYRVTDSLALRSNLTLHLDTNTSLFSDQQLCDPHTYPASPCEQNPRCPTLYWSHGPTAVLCGTNLTNVAITGEGPERGSVIDGGGWPWYDIGVKDPSRWGTGPRSFEVTWSRNVTVSGVRFQNSPSWTVHPTFCEDVLVEHIEIRNPRFTPNTDGFDPDSCVNVVLRDSLIDTGDDGISIKSMNSTIPGSEHVMMPTRNVHIHHTKVLSRNMCVGSATFGGVYDVVVEDCDIGDLEGSSPWAIKYKSHQNYPGPLKNHTWRRLNVGKIWSNTYQQQHAGYFMSIELRYHPLIPNRTCEAWKCPTFENITFEDINIAGAQRAGDINGFQGDLLRGLAFRNVTFETLPKEGWTCGFVDMETFTSSDVKPPLQCSSGE